MTILFRNTSLSQEREYEAPNITCECEIAHIRFSVSEGNLWLTSVKQRNRNYQHHYPGISQGNQALWTSVILTKHCSGPLHPIRHHWCYRVSSVPENARAAGSEMKIQVLLILTHVPGVLGLMKATQTRLQKDWNSTLPCPGSPCIPKVITESSMLAAAFNNYVRTRHSSSCVAKWFYVHMNR